MRWQTGTACKDISRQCNRDLNGSLLFCTSVAPEFQSTPPQGERRAADVTKYTTPAEQPDKAKTSSSGKGDKTTAKPASAEQKEELETYCKKKNLDLERLLVFNNVTRDSLTEQQADNLLIGLKNRYGE